MAAWHFSFETITLVGANVGGEVERHQNIEVKKAKKKAMLWQKSVEGSKTSVRRHVDCSVAKNSRPW